MTTRTWLETIQPEAEAEVLEEEVYGGNSINDPNPSGNPDEDDEAPGIAYERPVPRMLGAHPWPPDLRD